MISGQAEWYNQKTSELNKVHLKTGRIVYFIERWSGTVKHEDIITNGTFKIEKINYT